MFEPQLLFTYAIKTAMHYHYAAIAKSLSDSVGGPVPEAARSFSRQRSGRPVTTKVQQVARAPIGEEPIGERAHILPH